MSNLVNNLLSGYGLSWYGLTSKILTEPQTISSGPDFVWILSTNVLPQPSNKRGVWKDDGVWVSNNVWYG